MQTRNNALPQQSCPSPACYGSRLAYWAGQPAPRRQWSPSMGVWLCEKILPGSCSREPQIRPLPHSPRQCQGFPRAQWCRWWRRSGWLGSWSSCPSRSSQRSASCHTSTCSSAKEDSSKLTRGWYELIYNSWRTVPVLDFFTYKMSSGAGSTWKESTKKDRRLLNLYNFCAVNEI